MKREILFGTAILCFSQCVIISGQNKDKALFRESKPGFYQNSILKDDRMVREKQEPEQVRKSFAVDLSSASLPNKMELYRIIDWHNLPVSQGNTSTCWKIMPI